MSEKQKNLKDLGFKFSPEMAAKLAVIEDLYGAEELMRDLFLLVLNMAKPSIGNGSGKGDPEDDYLPDELYVIYLIFDFVLEAHTAQVKG